MCVGPVAAVAGAWGRGGRRQHRPGGLGPRPEQEVPEALERGGPILQELGEIAQRAEGRLEGGVVRLAERPRLGPLEQGVERGHGDVEARRRRHAVAPRTARNVGVSGYPRISLRERVGRLLGAFLPRPVVCPSTSQLAAR
jgi:hypothetical protein